ncbi:hypothetical protein ACKKBF_B11030 [Auxenochlorella protothecoides x Auxenochlorella symbiontica]|uniref:DUF1764 domain-containing protein n=1 Tax=Auxenochlorella protothecoides TaxID=3075 RepID=A0A1D2AHA5_AUXPR
MGSNRKPTPAASVSNSEVIPPAQMPAAGGQRAREGTAKPHQPSNSSEKKRKRQGTRGEPAAAPAPLHAKAIDGDSNEIDDLFGKLKSKQSAHPKGSQAPKATADAATAPPTSTSMPSVTVKGSKDDLFGTEPGQGRKRTEEGYAMYTEEELGWGVKAGQSDFCPFDCQCCF